MIIDISYEIGEPQTTSYKRITEPIFGSIAFVEEKYYPVITYEKHLRIVSRENREKKDNETPIHIWSVHIKNSDESDKLGKYVLLMAAAAIPYIGENTESEREIKIKEQDDIVVFVKEGLKDD